MSVTKNRNLSPERNPGNRRRAPRINVQFPVRYQLRGHESEASTALNISASGARLVLKGSTPACGSRLILELNSELSLPARTVWEHPLKAGECRVVGVSFESVPSALQGWLERLSSQSAL